MVGDYSVKHRRVCESGPGDPAAPIYNFVAG
jgi:hypothetical protein